MKACCGCRNLHAQQAAQQVGIYTTCCTQFELVGTLLALAIYNGHTLELPFPLVIYK